MGSGGHPESRHLSPPSRPPLLALKPQIFSSHSCGCGPATFILIWGFIDSAVVFTFSLLASEFSVVVAMKDPSSANTNRNSWLLLSLSHVFSSDSVLVSKHRLHLGVVDVKSPTCISIGSFDFDWLHQFYVHLPVWRVLTLATIVL